MARFMVRQSGNRVELLGGRETVWYEVSGERLPELTDHSFAIWHLLPTAIREGFDIEIDGPVCDLVVEHARAMAQAWELWQPTLFREVRIAGSRSASAPAAGRPPALTMFSGGVDSTHMLVSRGKRTVGATAVTIHGMDYAADDAAGFDSLLRQTAPLLERLGYHRIVIRSNAAITTRGFHAHGMALAGHAFLLASLSETAHLAADNNWELDLLQFPWGLNHVTNRLFHGRSFRLETHEEHLSRSQKIGHLAGDPAALAAITFCKRRDIRPRNCGRCRKCVRTKAMFLGMTGDIPPIFDSPELTAELVADTYRSSEVEKANLHDLHIRSRHLGSRHVVPGLAGLVEAERTTRSALAQSVSVIRHTPDEWGRRFVSTSAKGEGDATAEYR
jgi:hypothetical protein